eukprot:3586323-Prymnesium_polylepis.1
MAQAARGHERMSALIMVLLEVPGDIKPFLGLMVVCCKESNDRCSRPVSTDVLGPFATQVVIIANAFAFELLSEDGTEYSGPVSSWITAYALTMGTFKTSHYSSGSNSFLMLFFFHYFTLSVNIVLLNVLIAMICDTYERVQEKFTGRSLLQRAELLLEMEEVMSDAERDNPKLFP